MITYFYTNQDAPCSRRYVVFRIWHCYSLNNQKHEYYENDSTSHLNNMTTLYYRHCATWYMCHEAQLQLQAYPAITNS